MNSTAYCGTLCELGGSPDFATRAVGRPKLPKLKPPLVTSPLVSAVPAQASREQFASGNSGDRTDKWS